jgi:hypothetical protein
VRPAGRPVGPARLVSRNEEAALHTSLVHLGGPFINSPAKSCATSVKANRYTCVGITELCFCKHNLQLPADVFLHRLLEKFAVHF